MYTCHLWWNYKAQSFHKLKVAFNNAFRPSVRPFLTHSLPLSSLPSFLLPPPTFLPSNSLTPTFLLLPPSVPPSVRPSLRPSYPPSLLYPYSLLHPLPISSLTQSSLPPSFLRFSRLTPTLVLPPVSTSPSLLPPAPSLLPSSLLPNPSSHLPPFQLPYSYLPPPSLPPCVP